MEGLCCILDSEEAYALRLTECLNSEGRFRFQIRTFSDAETFMSCVRECDIRLLIVGELLLDTINPTVAECIICLSEGNTGDNTEYPMVMKYQAGDKVVREIMALYEEQKPEDNHIRTTAEAKLIGVYSPNGNCYKTSFCVALAHELGQQCKVLYINLEEFSGLSQLLTEGKYSLSDALYYYRIGEQGIRLLSVITEGNSFDYVWPASSAEDLAELTEDELLSLTERIVRLGGYEQVIIDMGGYIKRPWSFMESLDCVYTPAPRAVHEERRLMEFKKYLYNRGYEHIVDKLIEVKLPYDESISMEARLSPSKLVAGGFGRVVKGLGVQR